MTWPHVKIADVGDVITGGTPKTSEERFYGGSIPFVTPAELDCDEVVVCNTPRTLSDDGAKTVRLIPKDSVMVCCIGSLGKVAIAGCTLATNQQINSIVFDKTKVFPRYGYYACRTLKKNLTTMAPATTVAIVSKSKFQNLEIPLPPLEEQKRIAAILDQADALRRQRQCAINRLNQLGQSIFYEFSYKNSFDEFEIEELIADGSIVIHKDGNHGSNYPRKEEFGEFGIPFLSANAVDDAGNILPEKIQFLSEDKAKKLTIGWIQQNDVLLSHNASVGKVSIYDGSLGSALIGTSLTCFRVNLEKFTPYFLFLALRSGKFQSQLTANMSQTTRNQVPITAQRKLKLPRPPLHIQQKVAEQLDRISKLSEHHINSQSKYENLFFSLQHRAFRGEL